MAILNANGDFRKGEFILPPFSCFTYLYYF